jgi:hypothetical protein
MSITPNSKFTLTLAAAAALLIAIIGSTWRATNFLRDMRDDVSAIRRDIWTADDQIEFVWQMQEKNRDKGVVVPTVRDVRGPRGK